MARALRRWPVLLAFAVLLLLLLQTTGYARADESAAAAAGAESEGDLAIGSISSLLKTIKSPRPAAILFTSAQDPEAEREAAVAAMHALRDALPPSYASVHTVSFTSKRGARLATLLTQGAKLPALRLFGSEVVRRYMMPGMPGAPVPVSAAAAYTGSLSNHTQLLQWAKAAAPTEFTDPVTHRVFPSVRLVQSPRELRALLRDDVIPSVSYGGSASRPPTRALLVRAHLTTQGSEEVLAAVYSGATQAQGQLLVIATESVRVAALFGVEAYNTAAHVDFAALRAWAEKPEDGDAARLPSPVAIEGTLSFATATAAVLQAAGVTDVEAAAQLVPRQRLILDDWRAAVEQYMTASPLIKLRNRQQLRHALFANQGAIRLVFFLRASDEFHFRSQKKMIVDVATRALNVSWTYRPSAHSRQTALWTPLGKVAVFWVDAERHPAFTAAMDIHRVPALALLWTLPRSATEDAATAPSGAGNEETNEMAYLPEDSPIAAHVLTEYDLYVEDEIGGDLRQPRSGELKQAFPKDADELVRFLARPTLMRRAAMGLRRLRPSELQMEAEEAEVPAGSAIAPLTAAGANEAFLNLDRRYYDVTPREPFRYVHDILTGALPLPAFDPENDPGDDTSGEDAAARRSASAAPTVETPAMAEARKKKEALAAQWKAELEARQAAKRARTLEKNEKDEAARKEEAAKMREEFLETVRHERRRPKDLLVPRPESSPTPARRFNLYAAQQWLISAKPMSHFYIQEVEDDQLRIVDSL